MNPRLVAVGTMVLVNAVWGSGAVVTKAAVGDVPPVLFALLRFVVASAILLPLAWPRRRTGRPIRLHEAAGLGLTGVCIYYIAFNVGLANTTATQALLIQSGIPAVTAGGAFLFLRERLGRRMQLAIVLSVGGIAIIALGASPEQSAHAPHPGLGNALLLVTVLAWSLYTIYVKRFAGADALVVTAYTTVAGAFFLWPAAVVEYGFGARPKFTAASLWSILYLGAVSSAAGYLLYNRALRWFTAGQASIFINLMPLVGIVAAVILLGEKLVFSALVGGACELVGVWLASGAAPANNER